MRAVVLPRFLAASCRGSVTSLCAPAREDSLRKPRDAQTPDHAAITALGRSKQLLPIATGPFTVKHPSLSGVNLMTTNAFRFRVVSRSCFAIAVLMSLFLVPQGALAHQVQTPTTPAPCSTIVAYPQYKYHVGYAFLSHTPTQVAWNAIVYTKYGCNLSSSNTNVYAAGSLRVTGTLQYYFAQEWNTCRNGIWGYNTAAIRYQAWMPTQYGANLRPCGAYTYKNRVTAQYKSSSGAWVTVLTFNTPAHAF